MEYIFNHNTTSRLTFLQKESEDRIQFHVTQLMYFTLYYISNISMRLSAVSLTKKL